MNDRELQNTLPLLPGYVFNLEQKKLAHHRKSHAFDVLNKVQVFDGGKPGIGGTKNTQNVSETSSLELYRQKMTDGECVPAWVAFDRKVLRFYGYFQESIDERRDETFRVRSVHIFFYLEDDSIQVVEPRTSNSGMPQGNLIRRHRIPHPTDANKHLNIADLNVGRDVELYGKTFRICSCDGFTKKFLQELDIVVPENISVPSNPFETYRAQTMARTRPSETSIHVSKPLRKFLENDGKVLQFDCVWDDTASEHGDRREMELQYYLADDTIQVCEKITPNSGRYGASLFFRRGIVHKNPKVQMSGNVIDREARYTAADLHIGAVISLYGRSIQLVNCDAFTRGYYRDKFGVESFTPIQTAVVQEKKVRVKPESLVLKAPLKLFDPRIDASFALRFLGSLVSEHACDSGRQFVVSFFPSDRTMSIFEHPVKNSGIIGGKFMERSPAVNSSGKNYSVKDFNVGAAIIVRSHHFILTACDESTKRLLQQASV